MRSRLPLIVFFSFVLLGCSAYPLGMSKQEWEALSPQQKYEARQKQAEIDKQRAVARAAEETRRTEEIKREKERVARIYREGAYGSVLECELQGGIADFRSGWSAVRDKSFRIATGEKKRIRLVRQDKDEITSVWATWLEGGRNMRLCRRERDETGEGCGIVATRSAASDGSFQVQVFIPSLMKNNTLACRYESEWWRLWDSILDDVFDDN